MSASASLGRGLVNEFRGGHHVVPIAARQAEVAQPTMLAADAVALRGAAPARAADRFSLGALGAGESPFLSARSRAVRWNHRGVDHLDACGMALFKFLEDPLPDPLLRPAPEPVVNGGWRAVAARHISPGNAGAQHMKMPLSTRRSSER